LATETEARHGRKNRVAEGRGRTVGALVGLELGTADLADFERASALLKIEVYRRALDRNDLAATSSGRPSQYRG
jgi:hypothetical protein